MSYGGSGSPVWSEWSWSTHWNCWERARLVNGNWEYEYDSRTPPMVYSTPRHHDTPSMLSSLAPQMGGMQLDPNSLMGHAGPSRPAYPSTGIARSTAPIGTTITTRNANVKFDEMDKRFKQCRSDKFVFGRIFKVVWYEPYGTGGTEITVDPSRGKNPHGKVRRFVVVDTRKGHSICLPIFTYGGQGTFKAGCHPEDHAVIYSSKKPQCLPGEVNQISKKSIKCIMDGPEHKLDPASRLNYAKLYTVEHNVKVLFVGRISEDYEQKVVVDYNRSHPALADRPGVSDVSSADLTRNAEGGEGGDSSYSLHATPQVGVPQYGSMGVSSTPAVHFDPNISSQGEQFGTTQNQSDYVSGNLPY